MLLIKAIFYIRRKEKRSGQALIELAVFGMIALMALGYMIRIGLRLNYNQASLMGGFRMAESVGRNASARGITTYYHTSRQVPDPTDDFATKVRERSGGGGYVEWGNTLTYSSGDGSGTDVWAVGKADGSGYSVTHLGEESGDILIVSGTTMINDSTGGSTQTEDSTSFSSGTTTHATVSGLAGGSSTIGP